MTEESTEEHEAAPVAALGNAELLRDFYALRDDLRERERQHEREVSNTITSRLRLLGWGGGLAVVGGHGQRVATQREPLFFACDSRSAWSIFPSGVISLSEGGRRGASLPAISALTASSIVRR